MATGCELFDHRRGVVQIRLQALRVTVFTGCSLEVLHGQFWAVLAADCGEVMVVGDPDTAAGNGRGPAVFITFFDNQNRQALISRKQGRGHGAGTGADNNYVIAGLRLIVSRHYCYALR